MWNNDPEPEVSQVRRISTATIGPYFVGVDEDATGRIRWILGDGETRGAVLEGLASTFGEAQRAVVAELRRCIERLGRQVDDLERDIEPEPFGQITSQKAQTK